MEGERILSITDAETPLVSSSLIPDNNQRLTWHSNALFFSLVWICHVHVTLKRIAGYETWLSYLESKILNALWERRQLQTYQSRGHFCLLHFFFFAVNSALFSLYHLSFVASKWRGICVYCFVLFSKEMLNFVWLKQWRNVKNNKKGDLLIFFA